MENAKLYRGFADLEKCQVRGRDFRVVIRRQPSSRIAVIAPHGGGIEPGTSQIAHAIAGQHFNFYALEGIRSSGNYRALHLTSRRFDDPDCLSLIETCTFVVSIHGCRGDDERVLLGGLDTGLKARLGEALHRAGVNAEIEGHRYPATDPANICNRGSSGRGVQLELTGPLRRPATAVRLVHAVRSALQIIEYPAGSP